MRIAFISDTHFGFQRGTERENDCWETVEEALRRAQEMNCNLVVHAGDMFDMKLPRPEDWARALQVFSKSKIPLIAIHGNHERRGKGMTNPAEGLSRGGHIDYINATHKVYEFNGSRVAVHGIGWVPETYARDVLKNWNPKPVENAYNILILHQSIHPFIFNPIEPPSIRLEDLPQGFDLYVDGHIHEHQVTNVHGKPFMVVGSTVTTQTNRAEASNGKGFVIVDVENNDTVKIEKIPLNSRRVFYNEVEVDGHKPEEVKKIIEDYVQETLKQTFDKKPLVRVRIVGKLSQGASFSDVDVRGLRDACADKCILSVGSKLAEEQHSSQLLHEIREQRLSVEELGFKLLRDFLKAQNSAFAFEDVFEHLVDGDADAVLVALLSQREEKAIAQRMEAVVR